jgi:four helix bundle protein
VRDELCRVQRVYAGFQGTNQTVRVKRIVYSRKLPRGEEFRIIKGQLIRAATSTAANYRAAQRAKSKADFISKLGTTEEEADESLFWLECLAELATREHAELNNLLKEANELVSILVASRKRARE